MATKTRQLADYLVAGGVSDTHIQSVPHIRPGILQPAVAGKLLDGSTSHSGAYGTAQSDGHSYYYTDIKGSKSIKDPRIGAHFGSQRYTFSSLQILEQESATNGFDVYSVDGREWLRMTNTGTVGFLYPAKPVSYNAHGTHIEWDDDATNGKSFIEIVGYWNDANFILNTEPGQDQLGVSVNGGTVQVTDLALSTSSPLKGRYVNSGSVYNLVFHASSNTPGTTPAIRTLRIQNVNTQYLDFYGIELIAQDTSSTANRSKIQIPSQNVVSYGKKFTVSGTPHYDPFNGFTNGTTLFSANVDTATSLGLGTGTTWGAPWAISSSNHIRPFNGGRVVKWVDSSGTIKTSVTMMPRNAQNHGNNNESGSAGVASNEIATASATNAHTINFSDDVVESSLAEVAHEFHWREFGNGSANTGQGGSWADATMLNSDDNIAYVMDDGLTRLTANGVYPSSDGLRIGSNEAMYWTFIGTGVTLHNHDWNGNTAGIRRQTVAQNLPYGTHVLKINRNGSDVMSAAVDGITVYTQPAANNDRRFHICTYISIHQPKMPPIPEDACIIADYMLMADHVQNTSATIGTISKGVRRIGGSRDHFYNCAGAIVALGDGSFTYPFYWYGPGSHSGNTMTASIPYFGTSFTSFVEDKDRAGYAHTLDGSSVTATGANSDETRADLFYYSVSTLGQHTKVCTLPAGGYRFCATDVATPIHTSSHYQAFETPFLYELVGGDRNMEQHNLIVTPDGKTWDEVTRDTSYIGDMALQIMSDTGEIDAGTAVIMDEVRGYGTDSKKINQCNKDFAIGYNKQFCLRDGEYEFHIGTILHTAATQQQVDFKVNGNDVAKGYTNDNTWTHNHLSGIVHLKRGDYVQVFGGYWGNNDNHHSEYYIRGLK